MILLIVIERKDESMKTYKLNLSLARIVEKRAKEALSTLAGDYVSINVPGLQKESDLKNLDKLVAEKRKSEAERNKTILDLSNLIHEIRGKIGAENQKVGINDLMNDIRKYELELSVVENNLRAASRGESLEESVEKFKQVVTDSEKIENAKERFDWIRANGISAITVVDLQELKEHEAQLIRNIAKANDKIRSLNISTLIQVKVSDELADLVGLFEV
jgi:hypothetical protein